MRSDIRSANCLPTSLDVNETVVKMLHLFFQLQKKKEFESGKKQVSLLLQHRCKMITKEVVVNVLIG